MLTEQCTWSVTGSPTGENYYVWDVDDEWMRENHDTVTVKCDPVAPWGEVHPQSESDLVVMSSRS